MRDPNKYLEVWKLSKAFPSPKGPYTVVQDFDLFMREGEFVSLIGHSGCGKSTVLSIIAGLAQKTTGSMILADKEVRGAGPDRGVVFQAPSLLPWMTAFDNVMLGVDQVYPDAPRAQRRQTAAHYLALVGLKDAMHKMPGELSQGMRQRVGIARAFALSPKMLLLDEPFGMLDSLTRLELQEILLTVWRERKITALMVTHDVDEALFLSDRVVMMTSGPFAKVGDVLPVPFERPRDRQAVLNHPEYYRLREHLIGFLEGQDHHKPKPVRSAPSDDAPTPVGQLALA
jgi:nitrate ABC transporter ATP-binding subunit